MDKLKKEETNQTYERKPWLSKKTGFWAITILSVALAVWIGWQVAAVDTLLNGVLWGLGFGGSIWLVFFGMNFFHRLFNRKPKK